MKVIGSIAFFDANSKATQIMTCHKVIVHVDKSNGSNYTFMLKTLNDKMGLKIFDQGYYISR